MSRNGDVGAHKGTLGVVCGSHVVGSTPSGFDTGSGIRETLSLYNPIVLGHSSVHIFYKQSPFV